MLQPFLVRAKFGRQNADKNSTLALKEKAKQSIYQTFRLNWMLLLVPLTDEILNLWDGFLEIVDYLQSTPQITKLIESL